MHMKQINIYIFEKLKIGKEVKVEQATWKWFCDTYHIEERSQNTFFCKDNIASRLLQGLNSLTDKKNNYLTDFIKNCKKDYKDTILSDLGIHHIPENKFEAEGYRIKIISSAHENTFVVFSMFPSDKIRFGLEFFKGTDQERTTGKLLQYLRQYLDRRSKSTGHQ